MDGFVFTAAKFAQDSGFHDVQGLRAMGFYDAAALPYYYFMATQFATSDRWFSPVMARTQPNRIAGFAVHQLIQHGAGLLPVAHRNVNPRQIQVKLIVLF